MQVYHISFLFASVFLQFLKFFIFFRILPYVYCLRFEKIKKFLLIFSLEAFKIKKRFTFSKKYVILL